jgi:TolB-like protein/DNA-binding winged helix-turn-helix (wHTH) protein
MIYRFADCELDEHLYQLRRNGTPVALEPKVFDVLAYLLQHHDRVVSKDELLDQLWPGQVVSETALTQCVMAARKAVGDDGNRQHTIKTQHGRGYRFVAEVISREALTGNGPAVETVMPAQTGLQEPHAPASGDASSIPASAGMTAPSPLPQSFSSSLPQIPRRSLWALRSSLALGLILLGVVFVTVHYWPSSSSTPQSLPLPNKPSIIVLPFVNLSGDPSQEYFSDGMTEEITATLSRVAGLFVIARTSAFTYKGKAAKVQDISREMGVQYVLEGSVQKADGQVRIIAQLIDAPTGTHLWSERYDRPLQNIFALQDEIRQQITLALKVHITPEEPVRSQSIPTTNLDAYDFYLRGREAFWRAMYKNDPLVPARQMYESAVALDSQYAEAYAQIGGTYLADWFFEPSRNQGQSLERALAMSQRAIALNDMLPLPHAILGSVSVWKRQYEQALAAAQLC